MIHTKVDYGTNRTGWCTKYGYLHTVYDITYTRDIMFGNDADTIVTMIDPKWNTLAHIMHHCGVFTSVGEARRNGWDRPIPYGSTMLRVGKRKTLVHIFNIPTFHQWDINVVKALVKADGLIDSISGSQPILPQEITDPYLSSIWSANNIKLIEEYLSCQS